MKLVYILIVIIIILVIGIISYFLFASRYKMRTNYVRVRESLKNITNTSYIPNKIIICVLRYGIGNRLKCLSSSIVLSRYMKLPLYVVWTDIDMKNTQITDLCMGPFSFTILPRIPDGLYVPESHFDVWGDMSSIKCFLNSSQSCLTSSAAIIPVKKLETPVIIFSTAWSFRHPDQLPEDFNRDRRVVLLDELKPSKEVYNLVDKYSQFINDMTVGVHIRLTDGCISHWHSVEKCDNLKMTFKRLVADRIRKGFNIFLCSDDKYIGSEFKAIYADKIFYPISKHKRSTKEGQQQAYAELLALSRCPFLLLSYSSTFSGEVEFLANKPNECSYLSPMTTIQCPFRNEEI